MSLIEVCDLTYSLLVDRIERLTLAQIAAGADVDVDESLARLDEWLEQEPEQVQDVERYELLRAVGLW